MPPPAWDPRGTERLPSGTAAGGGGREGWGTGGEALSGMDVHAEAGALPSTHVWVHAGPLVPALVLCSSPWG